MMRWNRNVRVASRSALRAGPGGRRRHPLIATLATLTGLLSAQPAAAYILVWRGWIPPAIELESAPRDGIPGGDWVRFDYGALPRPDSPTSFRQELEWLVSDDGPLRGVETRAESWLGLDELEFGSTELTVQKRYGERLEVVTQSSYRSSSQREVRVEYYLGRTFSIRSEARERGEANVTLRSDLHFW